MQHRIDPKVDCVFKALLGAEPNRNLLAHFLNAILADELAAPIIEVEILDPYNEREFLDDKLSIVDVKARDSAGRLYQIEIQVLNVADLPARILYGWADLYSGQLRGGDGYDQLQPTYAIWLLGQTVRPRIAEAIHRFRLRDEQGRSLVDHGGIWLVEFSKCVVERVQTELERWLKFFIEGERLDDERLPDWMDTEEMQQAMNTLRQFSEKERDYHVYQARQNYLRQQRSIQRHMEALNADIERERAEKEQERQEKQAALQREEAAVQEKQAAVQEIERLKALLAGKGGS